MSDCGKKKVLVLAGGLPQIKLIQDLQARGYYVILADYYENPVARPFADRFYRKSTLDIPEIRKIVVNEKVDFLITCCTDQALETVSRISEEFHLPCYISSDVGLAVTNKQYMKKIFRENNIPTAAFQIVHSVEEVLMFDFPLVVKPADCNSSKGVVKVLNAEELKRAVITALQFSRTKTAVVEKFIEGVEVSVDLFVTNGHAQILSYSQSDKIKDAQKFVIYRGMYPAKISLDVLNKIQDAAAKIVRAFNLVNCPMLIQLLVQDEDIYIVEFSARTGGCVKYHMIELASGVDVIKATVDITEGKMPEINPVLQNRYVVDEFVYCSKGKFASLAGFEECKQEGIIENYFLLKNPGEEFERVESSGDRLVAITIVGKDYTDYVEKHNVFAMRVKVLDGDDNDIMRHDLFPLIALEQDKELQKDKKRRENIKERLNKTEQFIESIDNFARRDIPSYVLARVDRALLDYIAVAAAGSTVIKKKLDEYKKFAEPEKGESFTFGLNERTNLKEAVFLNGLCAHALDYDDGTNAGIIHLGSPLFSVLLPLAEKYHIGKEKLYKAVVIGYETSFTMAVSIQPEHKARGYHATGTCGILGIALAVSYMLDFTKEQKKNAFAVACASATGVLSVLDNGSELKPYNVAKTALLGLISAQMAKAGFSGEPDALGSYRGFLKMMAGDENISLKQPMMNGTYAIEKAYVKPYAACRYCHPSIEGAISIGQTKGFHAESIDSINIRTYDLAVKGHDHAKPTNPFSAKMSIPYGVSVGLLYGKAGIQEYTWECLNTEEVQALAVKVKVDSDETISKSFPQKQSAVIDVHFHSGETDSRTVDYPKGEPENPMSDEEFKGRFVELATYGGKSPKEAERIYQIVYSKDNKMSELFEILGGG